MRTHNGQKIIANYDYDDAKKLLARYQKMRAKVEEAEKVVEAWEGAVEQVAKMNGRQLCEVYLTPDGRFSILTSASLEEIEANSKEVNGAFKSTAGR